MISESHLNIRDKCPEEFILIGRSKPVVSAKPRGGVVVYKNMNSYIDLELISDELVDCVVFRVLPVNIVIAAVYIPPTNSKYSTPQYMENLQLLLSSFRSTPIYIVGDLNARYGEGSKKNSPNLSFADNPDKVMNTNGHALNSILNEEKDFVILNGLHTSKTQCDSDFTFFRGELCSQIDIAITNSPDSISSFTFLEKNVYSDHRPLSLSISAKAKLPLDLVDKCATNLFEYKHYDVNRRPRRTVKLDKIDAGKAAEDI